MFEEQRSEQGEEVEDYLAELFERGETEDEVFKLLMETAKFEGNIPIQWAFEHQPSGEMLYLAVDSEDPLSSMGVKISGRETSSLEFQEEIVFKILWVDESENELKALCTRKLRELMEVPEEDRRNELRGLFDEANQAIEEKLDVDG
ncbi:MAG: hypothetical protein ABEK50_15075 [bacterium]